MTGILDVLSTSQLFGGLPDAHLEKIRGAARERRVEKGELLFLDGDKGSGFYLVVEGVVKVSKLSPEGREQILHIARAGEAIGAVPVFSGATFPASAEALTPGRLLFFPREDFVGLIAGNPSLTMNLLAVLAQRLREFTVQIENLTLRELPGRLAAYLLHLSQARGGGESITLDISKTLLSSILGTRPESLSRALGALRDRGLIEVDGPHIVLRDRYALEDLAGSSRGLPDG